MRTMRWGALAIGAVLVTANAVGATGTGMMGSANAMMQRIQEAVGNASGASDDEKGVACPPDGRRLMVSKIVGDERWMVTWDAHMGMGDVDGNVVTGGGRVVFLHCEVTGVTGPDPERDSLLMGCDAGDGVVSRTGWHHFDDVSLPGRFFLP